ncbi:hypothetical protein B0A48_13900 [Cryoendolithus antarcticus]|uniref:Pentatricopeptide repeat domain-containing protein n=1 Tax=Cryoendolithus antarcticus TaxID=1507870 RepID=A0A1V8SM02_9PEZI|nr:hypothetical protein B0A48_13900 [Cryoendolithus antarcticus]
MQMIWYLTSSTLWYSGIFAAAATLDAGRKVQRREKWDSAIADVKQELAVEGRVELGVPVEETAQQDARTEHNMLAQATTDYLGNHDMLASDDAENDARPPRWPINTGPQLQRHNLAPESIFASPTRRSKNDQRAWSAKKVEIIGISVDLLQLRTLLTLHDLGYLEQALVTVPENYANHLTSYGSATALRIRELQDDLRAVWKCAPSLKGYKRSDSRVPLNSLGGVPGQGRTYEPPLDLNLLLQTLFRQHKRYQISTVELLAKMSYTLSQTTSPPNLDTYNTLLRGMSHVNLPEVSRHVITSLTLSQLRPNEITISAVLDSYTKHDDAAGFLRYVEKMRGKHNGLSLARPDIKITDAGKSRLKPKEGEPDKIIQLPYPTPRVMSSLISGLLHFAGFDTALGLCKSFSQEGWGICMAGLSSLLRDCAARNDWAAGKSVWEQIQGLAAQSRAQRREEREKIPLNAFGAMLRLCLGSGEQRVYEQVWEIAVNDHGVECQKLRGMVSSALKRAESGPVAVRGMLEVKGKHAKTSIGSTMPNDAHSTGLGNLDPPISTRKYTPFHQAEEASAILTELSGSLTLQPANDPVVPETRVHYILSTDALDAAIVTSALIAPPKIRRSTALSAEPSVTVTLEQLHGTMPWGLELDEYELAERPMELRA